MSGHRSLAFRLYTQLRDQLGNLFLSPYSIWTALALLYPGSGGITQDELARLLGIQDLGPVAELARLLGQREALTARQKRLFEDSGMAKDAAITPEDMTFRLVAANKLWVQAGYTLAPTYVDLLARSLDMTPESVDFTASPEDACRRINQWVGEATFGRIREVITPRNLSKLTRALVANAIYFKARWAETFSAQATHDARFHRLDDSTVMVPTMRQAGYFAYAADDETQLIELPYSNPDVVMDIVLPRRGHFAAVDSMLSMPYFYTLIGEQNKAVYVDLSLPRFRIETSLLLAETLQALGLVDAFRTSADFTALSPEPGFHIDEVLHRTFITVDEEGTEAAAVTIPMMDGAGMPPKAIEVRVDRPFFFVVRDVPSNSILFLGRCVDPSVR